MKKITSVFMSLVLILGLTACGSSEPSENNASSSTSKSDTKSENVSSSEKTSKDENISENSKKETASSGGKTLVAYYSATNNTAEVAKAIANETNGNLFELKPEKPYTDEDLDWTNENSRVYREHDNENERNVKLVSASVPDWKSYDTVYIGYPIWWGIAAWPVDEFIKENDFTNKTVIPFCTSASSDLGESGKLLKEMAGTGNWQEGKRFQSGASEDEVRSWVESLEN